MKGRKRVQLAMMWACEKDDCQTNKQSNKQTKTLRGA